VRLACIDAPRWPPAPYGEHGPQLILQRAGLKIGRQGEPLSQTVDRYGTAPWPKVIRGVQT